MLTLPKPEQHKGPLHMVFVGPHSQATTVFQPPASKKEAGRRSWPYHPLTPKREQALALKNSCQKAHYRELAGFKERKRRGRSQLWWDCLESAESKVKCRTSSRALALRSKQPAFPPCLPATGGLWQPPPPCPSLLIFNKGDFSLASVL